MKVTIEIDGKEQTVELPDETARDLKQIAARNGISFASALQQAITNENFLEDQQADGTIVVPSVLAPYMGGANLLQN